MPALAVILFLSLVGGAFSVLAAAVVLKLPAALRTRLLPHLLSFAIGALLGAAFLGLLPEALEHGGDTRRISMYVLIGILLFFLLEKMILRHCHTDLCEVHDADSDRKARKPAATMILLGDGIHNMVDGVLIAAAYLTSPELGWMTALAVAFHEIPQELGEFAILLHSGFSPRTAFLANISCSLMTVVGALFAYGALNAATGVLSYVLALAASSFIYVAVADLIPGLHRRHDLKGTLGQLAWIVAGVAVIFVANRH